ncbi:hypothetical protein [Rhizobium sp. MHM7A]|uniref:hypothetical protein n=1 Tax=Rhizobium sp. MHM7A TaxID=2583233 RepID=UPI0011068137|nr:hypothetical protein [Rhizobium sp. MHM7A]TLX17005.1 hypothetical protein FFR93_06705 [Rhizobium sp. MHM7A]
MAQALPLAGTSLANGYDPRVLLLNDLLLKGVAHLEDLRIEGVAKTNFMKCDERSIYVLEYLFKSPYEIMDADMPPLRRSHNHSVVRHLVDLLGRKDQVSAAAELSSALTECDPVRISDQEASTELRVCYMIEMHTLIFGILSEVMDKRLSVSLLKKAEKVRAQAILPETCRPGLAYMHKDRLIELLALRLTSKGHEWAAEIVLNQKGRPIW